MEPTTTAYRLVGDGSVASADDAVRRWRSLPAAVLVATAALLLTAMSWEIYHADAPLRLFWPNMHGAKRTAASTADRPTCSTCEQAQKSPLLLEYAYRSGLCPGAPKELGPGYATEDCLEDINAEYNFEGRFNGARPVFFEPAEAHQYRAFDGLSFVKLAPGEVTEQWDCTEANGCHDCDEASSPSQCGGHRGYAMLWVPKSATKATPRLLYVHGGSWVHGSPTSASYAPFCAMIAKTTGFPVLAIDYPLAPIGRFETILSNVGRATHWLGTHDPSALAASSGSGSGNSGKDREGFLAASASAVAAASHTVDKAPKLFISGDSSGGGSATSALLAQSSSSSKEEGGGGGGGGLPNANGALLAGGVLFSPWFNLLCDTPSYVSQIYKLEQRTLSEEREATGCRLTSLPEHTAAKVAIGGDVAFTDYPYTLAAKFAENGRLYAGDPTLTTDPIASPTHAEASTLSRMPPLQIHIGLSEVLVAENVIFATRLAANGASCELHSYDQMWHVFPQYYEGCEHPHIQKLLFAYSALNLTASFLHQLADEDGLLPWTNNGIPYTLTHYEYPRGVDTAMANYHTLYEGHKVYPG